jgi:beta-N-acetylglucosaminidase/SH3-like domain-containing protein
MKKYTIVSILIMFLLICSPKAFAASDITGHWAEEAMETLISKGIIEGDGNNHYFPEKQITRAEFTTMIVRLLNLDIVNGGTAFKDVKYGSRYYPYVMTAYSNGLINGVGNGYFNPDGKINRQEMAKIIAAIPEVKSISASQSTIQFADQNSIADWAYPSVQLLVSTKLIIGQYDKNGNLVYNPLANAKRADASTILARVMEQTGIGSEIPDVPTGKTEINVTNYPTDFATVVQKQANNSPKVDGAGLFTATSSLVAYYANTNNFPATTPEFYQYLKLTYTPGLNEDEINANLLPTAAGNPLKGTAKYFIEAGEKYNVNPIYLIVHALHETGNGTSKLSTGILVSSVNGKSVTPKVTYNMYGVKALDADPNKYGSEYAYSQGWFTPKDAIIGGAQFIANGYINNGQDTLYKMRWNPANPTYHQYATHVQWATIQAKNLHTAYQNLPSANKYFDVPKYANQPASSPLPAPENQYAVLSIPVSGIKGTIAEPVNLRTYPSTATQANIITTLASGTQMDVIGQNGNWLRVTANGKTGWISGAYVKLINTLKVNVTSGTINVLNAPDTGTVLGTFKKDQIIIGVLDTEGKLTVQGSSYKVLYNGKEAWVAKNQVSVINKLN